MTATSPSAPAHDPRAVAVHRIEVHPKDPAGDPVAQAAIRQIEAVDPSVRPERLDAAAVYLIEGPLADSHLERIRNELLTNPITEASELGARPLTGTATVEIHPLPGVMDPDAEPIELAIKAMLGIDVQVRTGRRYDFFDVEPDVARRVAERCFANTVIHGVKTEPFHPTEFEKGHDRDMSVRDVAIRELNDDELMRLSRDAHLFLDLDEMHAIQEEYRILKREPREIELETLAQTWSEHCVHKTLKATIRYMEADAEDGMNLPGAPQAVKDRPGHVRNDDGSVTIDNLLRSTVAAATKELMADGCEWCLSVFVDNAGIIAFDAQHAVCFKVETHNHPSAIEPYGGAATGIGGCIRDIIGTGLAAKPIASTDVFCVGRPDSWVRTEAEKTSDDQRVLPAGCLHPSRVLQQVVAGVRDYGNRMGIPTLNGAVWFDDNYVGNPLVYCGTVGVMPRDRIAGDPQAGDRIIALGGRTGRDGIHGATFSSAELTDTHADEFSHAVQIGNPVTEKKMLDAILEARDADEGCLYSAITDCGAGGFSSAVGEMGEKLGADVHLERAPLKYRGLTPTEIWISEAQERMVLSVPQEKVQALQAICDRHDVELCDLGTFGTPNAELILNFEGDEVGRMPMAFLHDGLPGTTREAEWTGASATEPRKGSGNPEASDVLERLMAHPNIASKHTIIRQYDHEVQGRSVIKPLVGPQCDGPSDAAIIRPVHSSDQGLAIGNGLATGWRDDPYLMTLAAMDECVRNLVCVGADPDRIAILDNFCWPSCKKPENLGSLVRAAEACYDGAKAYRTPFISGKDSLNNQFTTEAGETIEIPPTLLISGFGIVKDVNGAITMDAKSPDSNLVLVGRTTGDMGGAHVTLMDGLRGDGALPQVNLDLGPLTARAVSRAIASGAVKSAHDCSEGGLMVAAAEMAMAGGLGVEINLGAVPTGDAKLSAFERCFAETPSRYLLEVNDDDLDTLREALGDIPHAVIGRFDETGHVRCHEARIEVAINRLKTIWRGALNW